MCEKDKQHLVGVKVVPKAERKSNEDKDVYEKSSDVTVFNLYDQTWTALVAHGLDNLFDGQADFETKKAAYRDKSDMPAESNNSEELQPAGPYEAPEKYEGRMLMQLRKQLADIRAEREDERSNK